MASFERYYSSGIGTTPTTIHTSNASDSAQADILIGMTISNTGMSEATASAYITGAGATDVYLCKNVAIPKSGSIEVILGKVVLDNTDVVKVVSSTSQVDVWLSVLDNASA
tara:strand:+ start:574 stop:906 length:333 start_codon:yes stop_codon:yes gene_type:complete